MSQILKALGGALIAAISACAIAAPAASAEQFTFAAGAEDAGLIGYQVGTSSLGFGGLELKCNGAEFEGTIPGEEAVEVALTPVFEGCIYVGGLPVDAEAQGCKLVFSPLELEGSTPIAQAGVECEEGDAITFALTLPGVGSCVIEIPQQSGLEGVTLQEEGEPARILANIELTGLEYDQGGALCKTEKGKTGGTYASTVEVEGFFGEAQVNLQAKPLPQTVDISKNPITLGGKGKKESFEVINLLNEQVSIAVWLYHDSVKMIKKCGVLAKKGEPGSKCTEEIECVDPAKLEHDLGVVTVAPHGGAIVKVKGC